MPIGSTSRRDWNRARDRDGLARSFRRYARLLVVLSNQTASLRYWNLCPLSLHSPKGLAARLSLRACSANLVGSQS
jgi:hypothetical protein